MIIDPLSIAGILSIAFYLGAFAWFGRETLRVDEDEASEAPRPLATTEPLCQDC